jgi:hypothetical protein
VSKACLEERFELWTALSKENDVVDVGGEGGCTSSASPAPHSMAIMYREGKP